MKDELTVDGELIFKSLRIVIPTAQRKTKKQKIHSSHMGMESCL